MKRDNQQERVLTPEYLAGFIDGEGCFSVTIHPHPDSKWGWLIDPDFTINQHKQSREFLERIQKFFGCGKIYEKNTNKSNVLTYVVYSRRSIYEKIIPFIDAHPLISHKRYDYEKFRKVVEYLMMKKHHTIEGFQEIVKIAFSMNAQGKQRKFTLQQVLESSSETTRQASVCKADEDIVRTQQ